MVVFRLAKRGRLPLRGRTPPGGGPRTRSGRLVFCGLALGFMALGVIMGALSVNMMSPAGRADLVDLLEGAIHAWGVPGSAPPSVEVLKDSATLHLTAGAVMWVSGLFALGLPVVVLVLFVRGFAVGFTAGALIYRHGLGGLGLTLAGLVPGNAFLLPAFCLLGGQAFFFSLGRMVERSGSGPEPGARAGGLLGHVVVGLIGILLLAAGTVVDGYIVPVFLRWVVPLLG